MDKFHRYTFTLDLKDDPEVAAQYEAHHKNVWPDVEQSFKEAGIIRMEIYRFEYRLFMVMDVTEEFSFERKEWIDNHSEKVQEWESLMSTFQKPLKKGEKWVLMDCIYQFCS